MLDSPPRFRLTTAWAFETHGDSELLHTYKSIAAGGLSKVRRRSSSSSSRRQEGALVKSGEVRIPHARDVVTAPYADYLGKYPRK